MQLGRLVLWTYCQCQRHLTTALFATSAVLYVPRLDGWSRLPEPCPIDPYTCRATRINEDNGESCPTQRNVAIPPCLSPDKSYPRLHLFLFDSLGTKYKPEGDNGIDSGPCSFTQARFNAYSLLDVSTLRLLFLAYAITQVQLLNNPLDIKSAIAGWLFTPQVRRTRVFFYSRGALWRIPLKRI